MTILIYITILFIGILYFIKLNRASAINLYLILITPKLFLSNQEFFISIFVVFPIYFGASLLYSLVKSSIKYRNYLPVVEHRCQDSCSQRAQAHR